VVLISGASVGTMLELYNCNSRQVILVSDNTTPKVGVGLITKLTTKSIEVGEDPVYIYRSGSVAPLGSAPRANRASRATCRSRDS
jgi:hypothetical protein